jgi:hypothetical protein
VPQPSPLGIEGRGLSALWSRARSPLPSAERHADDVGARSTQVCQRERTEVHTVSEPEQPEPVRNFTIEERVASLDLLIGSLERRTDRARGLRWLLVAMSPILTALAYLAFHAFPILQACVGFCVYAGAVSWLICGDTSPLRSHRHG